MKILKIIIILVLIVGAFAAGIYFKDDFIKSNNFSSFQKINVGDFVSQVKKEVLTATPLNIGGVLQPVVLLQSKIITETNLQRQENGNMPALKENEILDQVASAKAADLFKNQYFDHVSPSGVGPGDLAQQFGYNYIVEGENLILGNFSSEKEVLQDWMNSPGHRANILNNRYTEIGAAIVKGEYKGETVWIGVQEFGLPLSTCSEPDVSLKSKIDSDKTQLDAMGSQIDTQKSQIDSTSQDSPAYSQMVSDYNNLVNQYNGLAQTVKNLVAQYNDEVNTFNNCVAGK